MWHAGVSAPDVHRAGCAGAGRDADQHAAAYRARYAVEDGRDQAEVATRTGCPGPTVQRAVVAHAAVQAWLAAAHRRSGRDDPSLSREAWVRPVRRQVCHAACAAHHRGCRRCEGGTEIESPLGAAGSAMEATLKVGDSDDHPPARPSRRAQRPRAADRLSRMHVAASGTESRAASSRGAQTAQMTTREPPSPSRPAARKRATPAFPLVVNAWSRPTPARCKP